MEEKNIEKLFKNFIYHVEFEEERKSNTLTALKTDINQFLSYLKDKQITEIENLDDILIREYIKELKEKNIAVSTYNRKLASVKKFYKYLTDKDHKDKGAEILIQADKSEEKTVEFLSQNEINSIRTEMKVENFNTIRDRFIFELLYSSGMTVSELLSLGELNFNLENREVYIVKNKSKKVLYFSEIAKEFYLKFIKIKKEKFLEEDNPNIIFVNNSNERLTDRSVRRLINKYAEKAGIKKEVSPYTIRHTFCIHMLKNSMPKEYLAKLLDIKAVSMLDIYEKILKEN